MIGCTIEDKNHWLVCAAVLFAGFWGVDYLVHGVILMDQYVATTKIWRPVAQMHEFMPYCVLRGVAYALLFAGGYQCWRSKIKTGKVGATDCPYRKSIVFGLWIGAIVGITQAGFYSYLPIPQDLALGWLAAEIVKGAFGGGLLALVYQWKQPKIAKSKK